MSGTITRRAVPQQPSNGDAFVWKGLVAEHVRAGKQMGGAEGELQRKRKEKADKEYVAQQEQDTLIR